MRYELSLDDLLADVPIDIDGLDLDADVDVVVHFDTETKEYEVRSIKISDVYLRGVWNDLVKLDQASLKSLHKSKYEAFVSECEKRAIAKAKMTPAHDWERYESLFDGPFEDREEA